MRFLQLLVGGIHDALLKHYKNDAFPQAVSFACFGIFANIATVIILIESGYIATGGTDQHLLPFFDSKVLWVLLMAVVFAALLLARSSIMAADRIDYPVRSDAGLFLSPTLSCRS